jgi:DNA-binding NarL/FixJ family response regulator
MIRVLLVDDQLVVRRGLRVLLDDAPDIEVVGEAVSGPEAVAAVGVLHPDVVLMDVRMPDGDGIAATRTLSAEPDPVPVVVVTTFDLDEYVFGALEAGAVGFLLKSAEPEDLAAAVRAAARGDPAGDRRAVPAPPTAGDHRPAHPDPARAGDRPGAQRGAEQRADRRAPAPGARHREGAPVPGDGQARRAGAGAGGGVGVPQRDRVVSGCPNGIAAMVPFGRRGGRVPLRRMRARRTAPGPTADRPCDVRRKGCTWTRCTRASR